MAAEPITEYVITEHAALEMNRRGIPQDIVRQVLNAPEQRHGVRIGRDVLQSRIVLPNDRIYLVRVFVDVDRQPAEVVTVYRTSKIDKYWR